MALACRTNTKLAALVRGVMRRDNRELLLAIPHNSSSILQEVNCIASDNSLNDMSRRLKRIGPRRGLVFTLLS